MSDVMLSSRLRTWNVCLQSLTVFGSLCRRSAFNLAIAGWLPCGALLAGVAVSLAKDEAAMQARLADKVEKQSHHVDFLLPHVLDEAA